MSKELENQQLLRIKNEANIFTRSNLLNHFCKSSSLHRKEIAQYLNIVPSQLSVLLRLRNIPDIVRDGYYANLISYTHLSILSRLDSNEDMIFMYERILSENLTTLQTEDMVREKLYSVKPIGEKITERERNSLMKGISMIDPSITAKFVQTRVRARLTLIVNGSQEETTKVLRKIINLVESF